MSPWGLGPSFPMSLTHICCIITAVAESLYSVFQEGRCSAVAPLAGPGLSIAECLALAHGSKSQCWRGVPVRMVDFINSELVHEL